MSVRVGYFGKLPSRGDFLRAGLSRGMVQAWDNWLQAVLPSVRHAIPGSWLQLRGWRFAFGPGVCGPKATTGLWLPSVDKVGRVFPLLIAAESGAVTERFLDVAEQLGRATIEGVIAPETLAERLRRQPCDRLPVATLGGRWWRSAGSNDAEWVHGDSLPDAGTFLAMLTP